MGLGSRIRRVEFHGSFDLQTRKGAFQADVWTTFLGPEDWHIGSVQFWEDILGLPLPGRGIMVSAVTSQSKSMYYETHHRFVHHDNLCKYEIIQKAVEEDVLEGEFTVEVIG